MAFSHLFVILLYIHLLSGSDLDYENVTDYDLHFPTTEENGTWTTVEDEEETDSTKSSAPSPSLNDWVSDRIIGGVVADDWEYPHQVSILRPEHVESVKWRHVCGGSIYNSTVIISSAHCYESEFEGKYKVLIGAIHSTPDRNDPGTWQMIFVSRVYSHPCYNQPNLKYNHDIALFYLTREIIFSKYAKPIRFARAGEYPKERQGMKAIGWGVELEGSKRIAEFLMKVTVRIFPHEDCQEMYESIGKNISKYMMCASDNGKDSCGGDSGGPLIAFTKFENNCRQRYVAGVVSFGEGCGQLDFPGVYINASYYICFFDDGQWPLDCSLDPVCPPERQNQLTAIDHYDCERYSWNKTRKSKGKRPSEKNSIKNRELSKFLNFISIFFIYCWYIV